MYFTVFVIIFIIYIPIFIRLTDIGTTNYRLMVYSSLVLFTFYVLLKVKKTKPLAKLFAPYIKFNLLFILISFIQIIFHDDIILGLGLAASSLMPFILVSILLFFLSSYDIRQLKLIMEKVFYFIGIMFLIQFILSIYSSYTNTILVRSSEWMLDPRFDLTNSFQKESLFSLIGIHVPFYFNLSMLLGQKNHAAALLAIYNVIFLYMLYKKRKRYYLVLVTLVLLAALLNATRAAIITILLVDILFYLKVNKNNKITKNIITIVTIIYLIYIFSNTLLFYFQKTDTLTARFYYYRTYLKYMGDHITNTLFGFGLVTSTHLGGLLRAKAGFRGSSFESEFFQIIFINGIIVFLYYIYYLFFLLYKSFTLSQTNKLFGLLIFIAVVGTSLTLGGIITIRAYQFFTLIYVYNLLPKYSNSLTDKKNINELPRGEPRSVRQK